MLSLWDKCINQSDRDTRLQLVLRSRVWFRLGVSDKWECPKRLWRKGLLALSKASEAINGSDSWVGAQAPTSLRGRVPWNPVVQRTLWGLSSGCQR